MKMTDDAPAPTSSTATPTPKLLWSTPRLVTISEAAGKIQVAGEDYQQGVDDPGIS